MVKIPRGITKKSLVRPEEIPQRRRSEDEYEEMLVRPEEIS